MRFRGLLSRGTSRDLEQRIHDLKQVLHAFCPCRQYGKGHSCLPSGRDCRCVDVGFGPPDCAWGLHSKIDTLH